jgi:hypothetical protein
MERPARVTKSWVTLRAARHKVQRVSFAHNELDGSFHIDVSGFRRVVPSGVRATAAANGS